MSVLLTPIVRPVIVEPLCGSHRVTTGCGLQRVAIAERDPGAGNFDELSVDNVNEMLAKNVPMETLRFISAYTEDFADVHELGERTRKSLPNLMVFGYLLKVLEERLLDDEPS